MKIINVLIIWLIAGTFNAFSQSQCDNLQTIELKTGEVAHTTKSNLLIMGKNKFNIKPYVYNDGRFSIHITVLNESLCVSKDNTLITLVLENDSVLIGRHNLVKNCDSEVSAYLFSDDTRELANVKIKSVAVFNKGRTFIGVLQPYQQDELYNFFTCIASEMALLDGVAHPSCIKYVEEYDRGDVMAQTNEYKILEINVSGTLNIFYTIQSDTVEISFSIDAINWQCVYPKDSVFLCFEDSSCIARGNWREIVGCDGAFISKDNDSTDINLFRNNKLNYIEFRSQGLKTLRFNMSRANSALTRAFFRSAKWEN